MRSHFRLLFIVPLVALGAMFSGCDSVGPENGGTFTVLLTDAPGDLTTAVVTIEEIYLQGQDGGHLLSSEPVTVNLLELQNEVMALAEDVAVSSGTYAQLRLQITGGFIEVEQADGPTRIYASSPQYATAQGVSADGHLQLPSYAQSGLKINLPGGAVDVDGDQYILLLDFNVAQSFGQQAGASDSWVMTPVIHASDFTLTGAVDVTLALEDGVVLPGEEEITLADFSASLDRNGDIITLAFEEASTEGVFRATFHFLNPGDYGVTIVAPEQVSIITDRELPLTTSVGSGATVQEAVVIESAEENG